MAQDRARHPRKTSAQDPRKTFPRKTSAQDLRKTSRASRARPAQVAGGLLAQPGRALIVRAIWCCWRATCATWPGALITVGEYLRKLAASRWSVETIKQGGVGQVIQHLLFKCVTPSIDQSHENQQKWHAQVAAQVPRKTRARHPHCIAASCAL